MKQVSAEVHLDKRAAMPELRRDASGEPVPGQVQNPQLGELPNLRWDETIQRIGGHPEPPERRAVSYTRRDSSGELVAGKVQAPQSLGEGDRKGAAEVVAREVEHLQVL
jgi:hypothetical protein